MMVKTRANLKIGDTVYLFDSNRRVYDKNRGCGPIWREHWYPATVTGETSRSWIIGPAYDKTKLPKTGPVKLAIAYSQEDLDRSVWVHDNSYELGKAVDRCRDYGTLKKIAELIGYEPKP